MTLTVLRYQVKLHVDNAYCYALLGCQFWIGDRCEASESSGGALASVRAQVTLQVGH